MQMYKETLATQYPTSDKPFSYSRPGHHEMRRELLQDAMYRTTGYDAARHGHTLAPARIDRHAVSTVSGHEPYVQSTII